MTIAIPSRSPQADWHRHPRRRRHLILSSYELLEFLEFLPETRSRPTLCAAVAGPSWRAMLAESVNESYRMRSAFQAANSEDGKAGFETEAFEFLDLSTRGRATNGATKGSRNRALCQHIRVRHQL